MPIYEYQCRSCGRLTDVRHGFDERPTEPCPECGGELARRYGAAGIVFKGSGFYVTDSRAARDKASGGGKSTEAKADGKSATETKPTSSESSNAPSPDASTSAAKDGAGSASTTKPSKDAAA